MDEPEVSPAAGWSPRAQPPRPDPIVSLPEPRPDRPFTPGGVGERAWLAVLESLTDGVVVADTEGRFLFFNAAAERMLRVGALDLRPADWQVAYGCYHEDGATPYATEDLPLAQAMRGETVQDCAMLIRNPLVPEGIWLSINGGPLLDDAGAIRGGVIVFRDITIKRLEQERARVLAAAVEQTADSVVITGRSGVIEYVNPAAHTITGYTPGELIGATPRVFQSGSHPPAFWAEMWSTLLAGRTFRGTIINRRKDGALYYSQQTITPIRDAAGTVSHLVSVGKDITDLRRAALRDSRLQLARDVQQRLLPPAPPSTCGFDVAAGALMADETGGDFYDFVLHRGGPLTVAVGDVSGHAFDAALVMARTHAYMRSIARTRDDPAEVLSLLNTVILEDVLDNQFVTALVARVDRAAGRLVYASAGHATGYVLDPGGTLVAPLESTGLPLGLFPETGITSVEVSGLAPGSLVVLLTDGVVEAENADGVEFGSPRALEVIRAALDQPATSLVTRLQEAVQAHAGAAGRHDDITVLVCRIL